MATERHERIAQLANEKLEPAQHVTPAQVAAVFAAWTREYDERKALGQIKPSTHSKRRYN